eukprot:3433463-Rhodomonas_salina.1
MMVGAPSTVFNCCGVSTSGLCEPALAGGARAAASAPIMAWYTPRRTRAARLRSSPFSPATLPSRGHPAVMVQPPPRRELERGLGPGLELNHDSELPCGHCGRR